MSWGQHFWWKNSILNGEWDWGEPRLVWIFRIQVNHHCELWDLRRLSFKISSGPLKKLKRIEKRFLIVKNIRFALPRCTLIIWTATFQCSLQRIQIFTIVFVVLSFSSKSVNTIRTNYSILTTIKVPSI